MASETPAGGQAWTPRPSCTSPAPREAQPTRAQGREAGGSRRNSPAPEAKVGKRVFSEPGSEELLKDRKGELIEISPSANEDQAVVHSSPATRNLMPTTLKNNSRPSTLLSYSGLQLPEGSAAEAAGASFPGWTLAVGPKGFALWEPQSERLALLIFVSSCAGQP